jgi:hypothetical protein
MSEDTPPGEDGPQSEDDASCSGWFEVASTKVPEGTGLSRPKKGRLHFTGTQPSRNHRCTERRSIGLTGRHKKTKSVFRRDYAASGLSSREEGSFCFAGAFACGLLLSFHA